MANWLARFFNRISPYLQVAQRRRLANISAGVLVDEDTSMKVSAFYRGVTYITTQVAKLPWNIKNNKNEITERDRIFYLLNVAANPEMPAMNFRILLNQHALIYGNGFAEIERDKLGRVVALWPLDPKFVDLWRNPEGKLFYRIMGGSIMSPGLDAYLEPKDVFHIRNFHLTRDGLLGQGVVAYASEALGIGLAADKMASGMFANSGIPSGVLKHKGKLSDEAFARLQKEWEGRKTSSVAILEEDMAFEPLNMDPQVLQLLDSRKFTVLEAARYLGLPPTKLFDTAASTYNNVENSNLEVATDTLDAWARVWESECDLKLLNGMFGGRYSEMDLYAIFRGDMTTRSNYFSKMMQSGAITPNEIREREGMPGYSGGDRFYIAVNNFTPADRVDEVIDAQVAKSSGSQDSQPQKALPEPDTEEEDQKEDELDVNLKKAALEFLNRE